MKITRDGKTYDLTQEELNAAYREAQSAYMRSVIVSVIDSACKKINKGITKKTKKALIERAAELYVKYEGNSEDRHYNCTEAVTNALSEFAGKIGKRKTALIRNYCQLRKEYRNMKKKKKLLSITGLTPFQTGFLKLMLRIIPENKIDDELKIEVVSGIHMARVSSLWYGGDIVHISYKGCVYHISADGWVFANLLNRRTKKELVSVKDENGDALFEREMKRYLLTDSLLYMAETGKHPLYKLNVENNNWWSCSATDAEGQWHCLDWILSDDNLFFGIVEVVDKILDPEFLVKVNADRAIG